MKPRFRTLRQRLHTVFRSKTVTLDGVKLHAEAEVVGTEVRREIIRGTYEFAERKLLQTLLRPEDRVLELGAGIGAVGLLAARLIGAQNVTSFEANPHLEPIIRSNYRLNDLHPNLQMKAVSEDGGDLEFFVSTNLLSSSLHQRGAQTQVRVESLAINEAIEAHRPTVMVLDVEGAEAALLPPANLDGVRALLIETHANIVGQDAIDAMESSLLEKGFNVQARHHRNIVVARP